MNWIKSRYRVTFGASVILDFGELVDEDLKPTGTALYNLVPLIRADVPLIRDGKNPSFQFGFQVQRRATPAAATAMDAAARTTVWDEMIAWAATAVQECRIDVQDGATAFKFTKSRIISYTPQVRTIEIGRYVAQYSLLCAGLQRV
jgi:hypothetical protein